MVEIVLVGGFGHNEFGLSDFGFGGLCNSLLEPSI
jgi:hypothetical protein